MSLPYTEDEFISESECQRLIDYALANKGSTRSLNHIYEPFEGEWIDHGAMYWGNSVDPVTPEEDDPVVLAVNAKVQTFQECTLEYAGIVRWPVDTWMKPHVDSNTGHKQNVLAAMLYLNDGFTGGNLIFKDIFVEPKPGRLFIFKNSENLHYVNKVEGSERFVLSFWYHI